VDTQVVVRIAEDSADAERLAELTDGLRSELLELDVDDVRRMPGAAPPPGSRGVDPAAVGALLVTLNGSVQLVAHLVTVARSWLDRSSTPRTVELTVGDATLRLSAATADQQDRLIDEFLQVIARE